MINITDIQLLQYSLATPLIAALLAAIIPYRNIRDGLVFLTSAALPFFIYKIYQLFLSGTVPLEWKLFEIIPGIALHFKLEALGVIFAIILALLWPISLLYSIGYMRSNNEGNLNRFFAFFCLSIFASVGIAFSGNLLTLFLFYELLTLTTYPLVTHNRSDKTRKAGRVYLGILMGTSLLFFLPAIILTYSAVGTLDFTVGGILGDKISPTMTIILLALFMLGIAKAALIPLHRWLPRAMVAPAPVSALLHAVAVVKAGVFTIIKVIVYIFGIDNLEKLSPQLGQYSDWLLYLAAFGVIFASIVALSKDGLKQILAYSTISQLAYVTMSLAIFSPKAVIAAVFQIAAHAFAKAIMFFSVGAVSTVTGKKKVSEIYGVGRRMPVTMACFAIAALALIGLPPTAGFIA